MTLLAVTVAASASALIGYAVGFTSGSDRVWRNERILETHQERDDLLRVVQWQQQRIAVRDARLAQLGSHHPSRGPYVPSTPN